jgi:hypothetical protein
MRWRRWRRRRMTMFRLFRKRKIQSCIEQLKVKRVRLSLIRHHRFLLDNDNLVRYIGVI